MKGKETTTRTAVKTASFKLFTTGITVLVFGLPIGEAILLHIAMTVVFILHERGWNLIKWGRS